MSTGNTTAVPDNLLSLPENIYKESDHEVEEEASGTEFLTLEKPELSEDELAVFNQTSLSYGPKVFTCKKNKREAGKQFYNKCLNTIKVAAALSGNKDHPESVVLPVDVETVRSYDLYKKKWRLPHYQVGKDTSSLVATLNKNLEKWYNDEIDIQKEKYIEKYGPHSWIERKPYKESMQSDYGLVARLFCNIWVLFPWLNRRSAFEWGLYFLREYCKSEKFKKRPLDITDPLLAKRKSAILWQKIMNLKTREVECQKQPISTCDDSSDDDEDDGLPVFYLENTEEADKLIPEFLKDQGFAFNLKDDLDFLVSLQKWIQTQPDIKDKPHFRDLLQAEPKQTGAYLQRRDAKKDKEKEMERKRKQEEQLEEDRKAKVAKLEQIAEQEEKKRRAMAHLKELSRGEGVNNANLSKTLQIIHRDFKEDPELMAHCLGIMERSKKKKPADTPIEENKGNTGTENDSEDEGEDDGCNNGMDDSDDDGSNNGMDDRDDSVEGDSKVPESSEKDEKTEQSSKEQPSGTQKEQPVSGTQKEQTVGEPEESKVPESREKEEQQVREPEESKVPESREKEEQPVPEPEATEIHKAQPDYKLVCPAYVQDIPKHELQMKDILKDFPPAHLLTSGYMTIPTSQVQQAEHRRTYYCLYEISSGGPPKRGSQESQFGSIEVDIAALEKLKLEDDSSGWTKKVIYYKPGYHYETRVKETIMLLSTVCGSFLDKSPHHHQDLLHYIKANPGQPESLDSDSAKVALAALVLQKMDDNALKQMYDPKQPMSERDKLFQSDYYRHSNHLVDAHFTMAWWLPSMSNRPNMRAVYHFLTNRQEEFGNQKWTERIQHLKDHAKKLLHKKKIKSVTALIDIIRCISGSKSNQVPDEKVILPFKLYPSWEHSVPLEDDAQTVSVQTVADGVPNRVSQTESSHNQDSNKTPSTRRNGDDVPPAPVKQPPPKTVQVTKGDILDPELIATLSSDSSEGAAAEAAVLNDGSSVAKGKATRARPIVKHDPVSLNEFICDVAENGLQKPPEVVQQMREQLLPFDTP